MTIESLVVDTSEQDADLERILRDPDGHAAAAWREALARARETVKVDRPAKQTSVSR